MPARTHKDETILFDCLCRHRALCLHRQSAIDHSIQCTIFINDKSAPSLSLSPSLYIYGQGEHGKHLKPPNDGNCLTHMLAYSCTSLNPVPNAQMCVYLTVHITKLQLQTTFPEPLYIPHFHISHVSIGTVATENLDVCTACDP